MNLLNISWTPGNSTESISHYVVQLDNNIPVWVHNTSILLSDQSPEAIHTLRLEAVDMCGQTSKAVMPDMPVMQVLDTTAPTSTTLNKGGCNNCNGLLHCTPLNGVSLLFFFFWGGGGGGGGGH